MNISASQFEFWCTDLSA